MPIGAVMHMRGPTPSLARHVTIMLPLKPLCLISSISNSRMICFDSSNKGWKNISKDWLQGAVDSLRQELVAWEERFVVA